MAIILHLNGLPDAIKYYVFLDDSFLANMFKQLCLNQSGVIKSSVDLLPVISNLATLALKFYTMIRGLTATFVQHVIVLLVLLL